MKTTVTVVVLDGDQVLLHRRRDYGIIWALPGGGIDPEESMENAAAREVLEETGYEVAIDRFTGQYHLPQVPVGGQMIHVYAAHVTGGEPIESGPETLAVGWYPLDKLPFTLYKDARRFIADVVDDRPADGVRTIDLPLPERLLGHIALAYGALFERVRNGGQPKS
ncbi:MAG: NUDIX domain-containing protein [Anaerolineae bacterium]|nr:NUDIX domain-containing protein [Anaerolineae bacterium]